MKIVLLATGLLTVALLASSASNTPAILNFQGAPPNPPAAYPGLHSDEAGSAPGATVDYADATQNVSAFFFSGTQNAGMNTPANTSQALVRQLYLDLSSGPSLSTTPTFPFAASTTSGMIHTASGGASLISQEMLKSDLSCCDNNGLMTVTPSSVPRYGRLTVNFADPQGRKIKWALRWGPSLATPGTSAYLRTSASVNASGATVWTVNTVADGTPGFPCQVNCDVAELSYASDKPNATYSVVGDYHVPFLFTARKK